MTEFERAVEALMEELNREIGSGLLSSKALELMTPIQRELQSIKRLEAAQRQLLTPPDSGLHARKETE